MYQNKQNRLSHHSVPWTDKTAAAYMTFFSLKVVPVYLMISASLQTRSGF